MDKKNKEEEEALKNIKVESTLSKDDERYINEQAQKRKAIADSIQAENRKKADEWTRLSIDAQKAREQNKKDKFKEELKKKSAS